MKVIMDNMLHFKTDDLDERMLIKLRKRFRQKNPDYEDDKTQSEYIKMYIEKNNRMYVPRGVQTELLDILPEGTELVDKRLELEEIEFNLRKDFVPYRHQRVSARLAKILTQGTIESPCFREDTLIKTETGYKEIKDVKAGEYVFSYDIENDETVLKKVVRNIKNPLTERLVKVTINKHDGFAREIICTENHKFFSNGKWVKAKDLAGKPVSIDKTDFANNRAWLKKKYVDERMLSTEIEKLPIVEQSHDVINQSIAKFGFKKDYPELAYCRCGCGKKVKNGDYCRGHYTKILFDGMTLEEKHEYLKNWIEAGYNAMMKGRKKWWDSLTKEEKLKSIDKFLKAGNKASLRSSKKGSMPQMAVYKRLKRKLPDYEWTYNYVLTMKNKNYVQIDIYCKELRLCIEHDGPIHRENIFGKERLEVQIKRDEEKNKILLHNNYTLIRIVNNKLTRNELMRKVDIIVKGIKAGKYKSKEVFYI